MLDINFIRDNPEVVKAATKNKNLNPDLVDNLLELDQQRRVLLTKVEQLRSQKNKLTRDQIEEGKQLKQELKQLEPQLKTIEAKYFDTLKAIPNLIAPNVPVGPDESGNQVVSNWGEPKQFDFPVLDHVTLGEKLNIIDIKTAATVTGARFAYLKGDGALLQFALINLGIKTLTNRAILSEIIKKNKLTVSDQPFEVVIPPVMIKPEVFDRMDRLKPEEERFYIQSDDKYLIGSAEHTLGPLHMDHTFAESQLPTRYLGYSTSFRREAGSYGKDTKGIIRVHQFDKLEMEVFSTSDTSEAEQDFLVAIQEYMLQQLEIPHQKVLICTGDMGKPDYRQIDFECWIPSQNKYRETHTSDLMTDYQARRLNTKVTRKGGVTEYVHMNDATLFALGRTIVAIIENYQQADGSIKVPSVLQQFIGKEIISK